MSMKGQVGHVVVDTAEQTVDLNKQKKNIVEKKLAVMTAIITSTIADSMPPPPRTHAHVRPTSMGIGTPRPLKNTLGLGNRAALFPLE